jgi:hypothetical protein
MKNVIATLLIFAAVGLFYAYIGPTYEEIKALRIEKAEYDEALSNSQKVQDARDELLVKYNSFSPSDLKRLEKLLPNYVDNIRLIIEIDSVASRHNMILKNVQVSVPAAPSNTPTNQALQAETVPYGITDFSFDVSGSYETYRSFVTDLEKSLRLVDIKGVSFSADSGQKDVFDRYNFKTSMQTYWLKQK